MDSDSLGPRLIGRASSFDGRTALLAPEGAFTYDDLLSASANAATGLLAGRDDLAGERICYLIPPGWEYTAVQWGVWRAGGFGVPLATSHPESELAWVLDDAPFFQYSITLPGRTLQPPSAALESWCAEFDTLYREDRAFTLAMHPQIIGRGSRLVALEGLIQHALGHPGVWFARCDEVAEAIRPALQKAL